MRTLKRFVSVVFSLFVIASFAAAQTPTVDAIDRYIESSRNDWKVPGLSVAVVKDGKVLLTKGYGRRELGKSDAVDAQTLFGAMSTTKAMTAVGMAMLVDEGKVNWGDSVTDHLPDFRVADPYVTNNVDIRDLFIHNTGMPNTDFLWSWGTGLTADQILERMRLAEPATSFRGGFIYQNVMYVAAGKVIEKASGMPWDRFMEERVFRRLGMRNTFATIRNSLEYANRTSAHYEVKGTMRVIPEMSADQIGPAGSVWSTAEDMAIWMNFLLGNAKTTDGKELLKPATLADLFQPQMIIPPTFYPTFRVIRPKWTTYGTGWFQHDYRGEKVELHTGSLAGRTAIVGLIRDKNIGVYVFGNSDHAEVRHAIVYKVFDALAFNDPNGRDWSAEFKKLYDGIAAEAEKRRDAARSQNLKNTKPSLPLASYAGTYRDPLIGTMEVELKGDKLRLVVSPTLYAELQHRHVDTFLGLWEPDYRGDVLVSFQLSPVNGEVTAVTIGDNTLRRVPAARAESRP